MKDGVACRVVSGSFESYLFTTGNTTFDADLHAKIPVVAFCGVFLSLLSIIINLNSFCMFLCCGCGWRGRVCVFGVCFSVFACRFVFVCVRRVDRLGRVRCKVRLSEWEKYRGKMWREGGREEERENERNKEGGRRGEKQILIHPFRI